ncbi:hypothetical protein TNIN_119751 [Trichonephila inaurata madagascariensis]|uniref:Uncharacterized protein n=1 Tax=Trichonephila inaurata madagascariensis TaxID=2747483 RepID=A0A8X6JQ34_9ARAC|nr:hypothetical protein TNIN_119751 [Trichonephila inaurata madagascariensis]
MSSKRTRYPHRSKNLIQDQNSRKQNNFDFLAYFRTGCIYIIYPRLFETLRRPIRISEACGRHSLSTRFLLRKTFQDYTSLTWESFYASVGSTTTPLERLPQRQQTLRYPSEDQGEILKRVL